MIHVIGDTEYLHIEEFAELLEHTVPSIRYLIQHGNAIRKMEHIKEGSRFFIPVKELTSYPFVPGGRTSGILEIYHYRNINGRYIKELCVPCTYNGGRHENV
jgi:hypothetical protein